MKKIYQFLAIGLLGVCAASCSSDDDANITPAEITGLRAESTPGRIVLRWNKPTTEEAATIDYVQVNYYDHRSKVDNKRLASSFADSLEIPDTRKRYGDYTFTVKTVSPSGAFSAEQEITYKSEAAPKTWKNPRQYPLAASMFSTNAQDPAEGPIENLVKYENTDYLNTFFHTDWHGIYPAPHNMAISFPEVIDKAFYFWWTPRTNGAVNKPTNFDLMGSMKELSSGETAQDIPDNEWFLIKNFTKEADGLPVTATDDYTSPVLYADDQPFRHLKMVVNQTNGGSIFWTMARFKFFTYEAIDPENPADDGVEE